jgi:hypothetical protein
MSNRCRPTIPVWTGPSIPLVLTCGANGPVLAERALVVALLSTSRRKDKTPVRKLDIRCLWSRFAAVIMPAPSETRLHSHRASFDTGSGNRNNRQMARPRYTWRSHDACSFGPFVFTYGMRRNNVGGQQPFKSKSREGLAGRRLIQYLTTRLGWSANSLDLSFRGRLCFDDPCGGIFVVVHGPPCSCRRKGVVATSAFNACYYLLHHRIALHGKQRGRWFERQRRQGLASRRHLYFRDRSA